MVCKIDSHEKILTKLTEGMEFPSRYNYTKNMREKHEKV